MRYVKPIRITEPRRIRRSTPTTDSTVTDPMSAQTRCASNAFCSSDIDFGASNAAPFQIGRVDSDGNLDHRIQSRAATARHTRFAALSISEIPDGGYRRRLSACLTDACSPLGTAASHPVRPRAYFILAARLNADAGFDSAFGDSVHPGWTEIGRLALRRATGSARGRSGGRARLAAVAAGTNVVDANGNYCAALLRPIPDRLFYDPFDVPAALTAALTEVRIRHQH